MITTVDANTKTATNQTTRAAETKNLGGLASSNSSPTVHGAPELVRVRDSGAIAAPGGHGERGNGGGMTVEDIEESKKGWFAYFRTKQFYIVLLLGYVVFRGHLRIAGEVVVDPWVVKTGACTLYYRYEYVLGSAG